MTAVTHNATYDRLAQAALNCYLPEQQGEVKLLCLSENATYAVFTPTRQRFVLRIHRPGYHSHQAISSELAWLAALQADGFEVPQPIAGQNGELIQRASVPERDSHWVVLFHWIEGHEPHSEQNLQASFRRLGAINARLHTHARTWQPPAGFQRLTWDHPRMVGSDAHWGHWKHAPHLPRNQWSLIEQVVGNIEKRLSNYSQQASRFGLIHADLRLANLLVDGERTRIIDFDDCGFGWYLHDLASALSFHEDHIDTPRWIESWLAGYTRVSSLDQNDLDILPTLIIQRRLQLLAWTGSHADTATVRQLGALWVDNSLKLCRRYLDT
ncbi:phosphotransferase [Pseudomonas sp. MAFF 301449]|uniref:Phosphotransferase n=1 Tax=Pseudomonas cyclaminis TaxID=2781239 RepID=A0ABR9SS83_9PSED|nr:phosphotransferase [Pseudomonas cyclaminis]MBE8591306.1 phosphotransferase [Pseudomonas cyclaminis]MBE8599954.1 phosphotransferase [Pseudomonas cyclaminis]